MKRFSNQYSSGSITAAVEQARRVGGFSLLLDVEVTSEAEADEAIEAGADVIMLDNLEGEDLVNTARRLKERWSGTRKFSIETSGGIEEGNLKSRAINGELILIPRVQSAKFLTEVDILSTSAVHQSVQHIDYSLKIQIPKNV